MRIENKILRAKFKKRPNRFQAYVELNGEEIMVHVPNTGRCREILTLGTTVILREENNPNRKTKYDLIGAYKGEKFINIDSQFPNKVVFEALKNKKIEIVKNYNSIMKEKTFGNSRFDFKLMNKNNQEYYLEVKGVTFEDKGICKFPDAPTERGRKHLLELINVIESGRKAGVLFLITMDDVDYFTPYKEMDIEFANALKLAQEKGVDILAYSCNTKEDLVELYKPVNVILWIKYFN